MVKIENEQQQCENLLLKNLGNTIMNVENSNFHNNNGSQTIGNNISKRVNNFFLKMFSKKEYPISLPYYFNLQPPVKNFCGRYEELKTIHKLLGKKSNTILSQSVVICGLGGMGKTETARAYATNYKDEYKIILFLIGDGSSTLSKIFFEIAEKMNIPTEYETNEQRPIKDVVSDFYKCCSNYGKTLIIFDDINDPQDIFNYLPKQHFESNKPMVLITSRNQNWNFNDYGKIEMVLLKIFDLDTVKEFVTKSLDENQYTEKDIGELCETLNNLPLAIHQAMIYITVQNSKTEIFNEKYTINKYLKEYKDHASKLLAFHTTIDVYEKTIMTTWMTTIHKLKENTEIGDRITEILEVIAYVLPDDIPCEIFRSENEDLNREGIFLLKQYSLIDVKDGFISIHKLLQYVIKTDIKSRKNEETVLSNVLKLLNYYDDIQKRISYETIIHNDIQSHLRAVWNVAFEYQLENFYATIHYSPLKILASQKNCDMRALEKLTQYEYSIDKLDDILDAYGCLIKYENINGVKYLYEFLKSENCEYDIIDLLFKYDHSKNYEIFYYFLEKFNINTQNSNGKTFLMFACCWKTEEAVKYTIETYKPDMNLKDFRGETALFYMNIIDNRIIRLLISKGCDINVQNIYGETALTMACICGFVDVVKAIVENENCDLNLQDNDGMTAIMHTCNFYKEKNVEKIMRREADVNDYIYIHKQSALQHCTSEHLHKILNILLNVRCDLNIKSNDEKTVFDYATEHDDKEIISTLNKYIKRNDRRSKSCYCKC